MKQKAQSLEEEVAENSRRLSYKGEIEAIYQQLNLLNEQLIVNENPQRELDAQKMGQKRSKKWPNCWNVFWSLKPPYADQIQLENHFIELKKNKSHAGRC